MSLGPVEKVVLAREYEVANWLRDGLNEILSENPTRPLDELKSQLGVETACTLLWIQNQTLRTQASADFVLTLGMLRCSSCQAAMFQSDVDCYNCLKTISVDDRNALYLAEGPSTIGTVTSLPTSSAAPAKMSITINLDFLYCMDCLCQPIQCRPLSCPSCSRRIGYNSLRLKPSGSVIEGTCISQKILEEFGDEISRYQSWDQ